MNDYIINPSWFYWLSVVDAIKTVAIIITVLSTIAVFFSIMAIVTNYEYGENDSDYKQGKKCLKICAPIMVVTLLLSIFMPSENTLIKMMVANYTTKQNLAMGADAIKSTVDYIIEAIQRVKG